MSEATLDSSALLAVLRGEPGATMVDDLLFRGQCAMSTVNLSEVIAKLVELGASFAEATIGVASLGLSFHSFDDGDALATANLRARTRSAGLSLGDRACIALAAKLGAPVVTADQAWASADLPVEVILVR